MSGEPEVASPCNKVCVLDPATGLCIGCRRSLEEIARWSELDNAQRRAIVESLAGREVARGA